MKSRCVIHFVFIVTLIFSGPALTLAHAQTGDVAKSMVKVDVPFDFYVGNHRMPAGTYFLSLNPDTQRLDLTNADSNEKVYLTGVLAGDEQRGELPSLQFDHVAEGYFLKEIKTPDVSVGFSADKFEQQVAGTSVRTTEVTSISH
jgi:hypothetical protein